MNAPSISRRALVLASLCAIACDDERVVTVLTPANTTLDGAPQLRAPPPTPSTPAPPQHLQKAAGSAPLADEVAGIATLFGDAVPGELAHGGLMGASTQSVEVNAAMAGGKAGGTVGTRGRGDSAALAMGSVAIGGASGKGVGYGGGGASYGSGIPDSDVSAPSPGGNFVHAGTNGIVDTREDPLSTFGIDVDTGSWLYARRFLKMGRTPAQASVRVEEWVNALHYDYAAPSRDAFAIHVAAAKSPFTRGHHVVRVALQGRRMETKERKPAHVTFLVDVSGSMSAADKLPWARDAILTAVKAMRPDDTVAITTYAGDTRVALPSTRSTNTKAIESAVATLVSGGGTNMGSGMDLAYREANKELGRERSARVIVLSDGDANIGRTGHRAILASIKGYVSEGVTLSTVGFGTGNYNDHLMEQLADAGNGTYSYVGDVETMKRVFSDELTQTLEVIAQDAKIQVEWNPDVVASYRLLGYENRDIADSDFRNDKKDAGEIGAGHAVTALYEVRLVDPAPGRALGTVRVRHKVPRHTKAAETARTIDASLVDAALDADASAALGMALAAEILRGSEHAQGLTLADAAALLRESAVGKHAPERREAAALLEKAPALAAR